MSFTRANVFDVFLSRLFINIRFSDFVFSSTLSIAVRSNQIHRTSFDCEQQRKEREDFSQQRSAIFSVLEMISYHRICLQSLVEMRKKLSHHDCLILLSELLLFSFIIDLPLRHRFLLFCSSSSSSASPYFSLLILLFFFCFLFFLSFLQRILLISQHIISL